LGDNWALVALDVDAQLAIWKYTNLSVMAGQAWSSPAMTNPPKNRRCAAINNTQRHKSGQLVAEKPKSN
jgi:hypothetical protein